MRRWPGLVLAVAIAACAASAEREAPPSASEVFDRYLTHRGGAPALTSLRSVEREGWIAVDTGPNGLMSGTYHTCIRYPDRVAIEIDAGRWQVAQALRQDGPVECDQGFQNCAPASEAVAEELRGTADHANKDLLDREAAWRGATVTPARDGAAWRVTIEDGERWAEFDRADGRLRALGNGPRWRRLGQWRDIGGVTLPHRLEDYEGDESEWRNTVHLREAVSRDTPSAWCTERFGE